MRERVVPDTRRSSDCARALMDQLDGKVALITGSAGGIGLGIARACVDEGMKVALADRDERTLEEVANELGQAGAPVVPVPLDVTDRDAWDKALERVHAALGPVQLLVNNAGVSVSGTSFAEVDPPMWDRVLAVNLTGVHNGVHFALDDLRTHGGHIVNTASMAGLIPAQAIPAYVASKFGVVGYTEALRLALAQDGVGVSVLCPGLVRTRLWRTSRVVRGLEDTEIPPDDLSARTAHATMDPDEVGRRVVVGVRANDAYILTHADDELRRALQERHRRELAAFDRAAAFVSSGCEGTSVRRQTSEISSGSGDD